MQKLRYAVVVSAILVCCTMTPVAAEVNVGIGINLPNVSIGINLPLFPQLAAVPGYPVYYAPDVETNYFFYDGLYWVYQDDSWYASNWYNGPWWTVDPWDVPLFILRIPVRYYRYPPPYFRGWRHDEPPRWGLHWGPQWEQQRKGWNRWNRQAVPPRAPLPSYQRQYAGERYPQQAEQQQRLHQQHYRYQPRTKAVRQQYLYQQQQRRHDTQPERMQVTPDRPHKVRQEQSQPRSPQQQQPTVKQPSPVRQGRPAGPEMQQRYPSQPNYQQRGPARPEQRQQDKEQRWQPNQGSGQPERRFAR